ncbi:cellulose biosynthesis cyclic di-GMP-binding regulatory protein BcsB [Oscillatoria sp. CS-180]|uniref:cellulose biosynthesis cyclic di-GMP-binding regulatory protein BcsB n=1 Tax=Oscillatoria sp. CS-180 TaxID=3021720 RepID=UPI00232F3690|nr:cellulose biosynthesis cyclic di-GMP-binding regulatory protein BcsB [Oscillatoria sp. CS-180]MDB9526328.1 cellulose biosynthesis cyclic di-GMP-binding regulatory protein BcsB [Oscillatoria sp. CS-180]
MNRFRFAAISPLVRFLLLMVLTALLLQSTPLMGKVQAQSSLPETAEEATENPTGTASLEGDATADGTSQPASDLAIPIVKAAPAGQYVLEFNRSPVVQDRLRFEGIYDEARLWFTRPQNWEPKSVKVLLRYRHSAALYATRSNMTVLVNGTSIGSAPLNRKQGELGEAVFEIPARLIRDYNELVVAALQNNSPTCTQDPYDPSLWSEILPDSKVVFDFQPQPIPLSFQQYPYPIVDVLSLEPNRVTYLKPLETTDEWLTAASRLQSSLGRVLEYRPLETRLATALDQVTADEALIIIGTPENQPILQSLDLPLPLDGTNLLNSDNQQLPPNSGVLMMTTALDDQIPVLVVTGNGVAGVAKAAQLLVQKQDEAIATGQAIIVDELTEVPSPEPRSWPDYLPTTDTFVLQDLTEGDQESVQDITVWGSHSPALEVDFRALPDDQILPGSTMDLTYSYGPQINPLTSQIEVTLDGVAIGGERLRSEDGGKREKIRLDLPTDTIKPYSKMQINFRLDPRERRSCSRVTDQQLWGTIHGDTQFQVNREATAWLPDLKLLKYGFPFAAPQDLSQTAIALSAQPTDPDLQVLLEVSERLGRLSKADSIKLAVYQGNALTPEIRQDHHLIAIGEYDEFPLPEAFDEPGFKLGDATSRQYAQTRIQPLTDREGLMKQVTSPWNDDKVLLALSGQSTTGLDQVRDLLDRDALFYQIEGDTVLVSQINPNPSEYDPDNYSVRILKQARQQKTSLETKPSQVLARFQQNWLFLSAGAVVIALLFYGIAQHLIKRLLEQVGE